MPPIVGVAFFPPLLAEFHTAHPGIVLELREEGSHHIEALVLDRELDVGAVVLPTDEKAFGTMPFVHDELHAVLHPSHPLARRRALALRELEGTPFVLYRPEFALHGHILEACRRAGFKPHVASESSHWDFIVAMVAANIGVALLPQTICRQLDPAQVRSVPMTDPVDPLGRGAHLAPGPAPAARDARVARARAQAAGRRRASGQRARRPAEGLSSATGRDRRPPRRRVIRGGRAHGTGTAAWAAPEDAHAEAHQEGRHPRGAGARRARLGAGRRRGRREGHGDGEEGGGEEGGAEGQAGRGDARRIEMKDAQDTATAKKAKAKKKGRKAVHKTKRSARGAGEKAQDATTK